MNPPDYLIVFCTLGLYFYTALLLSLVLTPLSSKIARLTGILDLPDARKVHIDPMPRMGGLAMALSVLISILLLLKPTQFLWAYATGAMIIVFVGMLDDKISIPPSMKFVGEIIAVLVFILINDTQLTSFGDLLGTGDIKTGSLALLVTVFAMVGFINSLNLSDGLDGLAAGISVISCLFFMPLAYVSQQWEVVGVSVILLGVIIGFLRYNTYPAKLFMGDTGSLLLGFSLVCVAVTIVQVHPVGDKIKPITIFWFLSLPVVDTLYVMSSRLLKGNNPFHPDKIHLHHRLLERGFSHTIVVTVIYGLMFSLGLVGWWLRLWQEWPQFYILVVSYISLYTALHFLEKNELSISKSRINPNVRNLPTSSLRYKFVTLIGKSNKYAPFVLSASLVLPAFFLPPISRSLGIFALAVSLFSLTIYPWRGGKKEAGIAHALIFSSLFTLLLLYLFNPNHPSWMHYYLASVSGLSLIWVISRVIYRRRYQVILPTSFELLLIVISWFIPLLWGQMLDLDSYIQQHLIVACILSIPILAGAKAMMRRQARRNTKLIICLQVALVLLGVKAFW